MTRLPARVRYLAGFVAIMLGAGLLVANPAFAPIIVNPAPGFPGTVTVGQTFSATLVIPNNSTGDEATDYPVLTISDIDLVPACANSNINCAGGVEAGVFQLSATGTGSGAASCTGTWALTETSPGMWRFTPPGGNATLMLATGQSCTITYMVLTLRVPTTDVAPAVAGTQTNQIASSTASAPGNPGAGIPPLIPTRNLGADATTVLRATPASFTTAASSTPAQNPPGNPAPPIPGSTTDTATLSPPLPPSSANGAVPMGTITFNLYGPLDPPTCAGAPAFTNTVGVNGFGSYTTSAAAPITAPGTYTWVAIYSGDANYVGSTTACGDPAETVVFAQAAPTIVTRASAPSTVGQPISDTATLSGGFGPMGTITFTAFGPNDATCAGPPFFSSVIGVNGNGSYSSGDSPNVTQAGVYRWTAVYSGDNNNAGATSPCNAPNESTPVSPVTPTIVTMATAPPPTGAPIGTAISDTATISGGFNPMGSITFTLFGPNNATCAGAPVFTSAAIAVNGNGSYNSGDFTPTAVGTYRWIAAYSGDANNNAVTAACNAPNEASLINPVTPTIVTDATDTATVGTPITDVATISGGSSPMGTLTFTVFGPNNATCAGPPVFTSAAVPVNGNGSYTSPPFTPTAPGTYRWIAAYSGDAANAAVTTACNDPNESTVVTQAQPAIVTRATPPLRSAPPSAIRPPSRAGSTRWARSPSPSSAPTTPPAPAPPSSPRPFLSAATATTRRRRLPRRRLGPTGGSRSTAATPTTHRSRARATPRARPRPSPRPSPRS